VITNSAVFQKANHYRYTLHSSLVLRPFLRRYRTISYQWYVKHRNQAAANIYSHRPQLPLWAIVSFGAYLLAKLGYGVLTFNDVPEAHAELVKQIEQARTELRKKGVDVD
jgi:alkanesulfonate monooxygenase SsuD/methylene tetrahydromethanopterin reductase-like flavin-dependent oxidoreductase (luciferase family)